MKLSNMFYVRICCRGGREGFLKINSVIFVYLIIVNLYCIAGYLIYFMRQDSFKKSTSVFKSSLNLMSNVKTSSVIRSTAAILIELKH